MSSSHASCVVWRLPCLGLRASNIRRWSVLQERWPVWELWRSGVVQRGPAGRRSAASLSYGPSALPLLQQPPPPPPTANARLWHQRSNGNSGSCRAKHAPVSRRNLFGRAKRQKDDEGDEDEDRPSYEPVRPGKELLSAAQIDSIFGKGRLSAELGNLLLAHLHGRRVAGTPEVELPVWIALAADGDGGGESAVDCGLRWLRSQYPIDEDAAILARIEREEREQEQKLIRRAERLGLYKPQSGSYGAELGDGGTDVYGKSVLKEIREHREAALLAEQEKKRREWLEGEHSDQEQLKRRIASNTALQKFQDSALVEARPRADPNERPLLAWIQRHHLRATNSDVEAASSMTTARRLLPSLAMTLVVVGLGYVFARVYEAPARQDRLWPDVPPAAATVLALAGVNGLVFVMWRIPPAWRLLNRYFISSPFYPYSLALLGSVFSHQGAVHLAMNMSILWYLGTKLHDMVGRGDFLDLYVTAGVVGSMASLAGHVLTGQLATTSLGASGALAGVAAAWISMHSSDKLTFSFLPRAWQEKVAAPAWVFLANLMALEVLGLLLPLRWLRLDHWAHLGGYAVGIVWASQYKGRSR